MPNAARFVLATDREAAPAPDASRCCCVKRVAPGSPGEALGLSPGTLILEAHGRDGATFDDDSLLASEAEYAITFWQSGERVRARLAVVDLGIEICPTPEGAATTRASHEQALASAKYLWEAGRWADLERVTASALANHAGWFGRLIAFGATPIFNTPLTLLHGAALAEQSGVADNAFLDAFRKRFLASWTTEYHAISAYYVHRARPEPDTLSALCSASVHFASERIRTHLSASGAEPDPQLTPVYFPLDYRLNALDGGTTVALRDTIASALPGQVLFICSLANYRGNGPYNDFMRRFALYARSLPDRVLAVHVITGERERRADRPHWYTAEDAVVRAGLPIRIALDEGYAVAASLASTGSPDVLVVDSAGAIIGRGEMTSFEWWAALAHGDA